MFKKPILLLLGAIKRLLLVPLLLIAIIFGALLLSTKEAEASTADFRNQIAAGTNNYRASQGLTHLTYDPTLERFAQQWAEHLAATSEYYHNPNLADDVFALPEYWSVAENLVGERPNGTVALESWLGSAGHHANIVGDYNRQGVGVAYGGQYGIIYIQVLARAEAPTSPPAPEPPASTPEPPVVQPPTPQPDTTPNSETPSPATSPDSTTVGGGGNSPTHQTAGSGGNTPTTTNSSNGNSVELPKFSLLLKNSGAPQPHLLKHQQTELVTNPESDTDLNSSSPSPLTTITTLIGDNLPYVAVTGFLALLLIGLSIAGRLTLRAERRR